MRKLKLLIIGIILLVPVAASAQTLESYNDHFSRGEALYRMDKYQEAYDEFLKAGKYIILEDNLFLERHDYFVSLSAAKAKRSEAQNLLEGYLDRYSYSALGSPDIILELGDIYLERERYDDAVRILLQISDKNVSGDRMDELNFKRGYSMFMAGQPDFPYFMSNVSFKSEYYPHAQYVLGYNDYRNGYYEGAKQYFMRIADNDSYKNVLPFYLLHIEFADGNYHYVRENGDAVIKMAKGERLVELYRMVGESWFHTGGWRETIDYLGKYQQYGGRMGREEHYMIGFSAYMVYDYAMAEQYLNKVAGPDDKLSQNASYHLADCYVRTGRKQQAMQSFAIASTEGYDDTISEDALFNYGKLQYELGGGYFNEAINVLNRYLTLYPNSKRVPQVKEYLAAAYYNSKNYDAAYQAIIQVPNPDNNMRAALQKITYFRALEYYNDGDYNSAEALLGQSLQNRVNAKYTALAGYWQGEILYRKGDLKGAAEKFDSYIKLSPKNEPENLAARYNLGYVYFDMKDWGNSKYWFDQFLLDYQVKDSYRADALNRRGDIEYSGRSYWKAVDFYDQAAALGTTERHYSAYQRAIMLGMVQRPERKIESLMEIMRKKEGPYVAEATYELGRTYIGQQRYSEGAKVLEDFVKTYPSSPRYTAALNELGLAYQNLNDNAKAMTYYKRVMELEKNSDASRSAMTGIQTIYVEQNDVNSYFNYAKSIGVETDLGELQRDSLAFAAARKVYFAGETKRAATALDDYITKYPRGAYMGEALYYAGENSVAAGDKNKALGYYKRLADMSNNDFTVRGLERMSGLAMEQKRYPEAADAYLKLSRLVTAPAKKDDALSGYLTATVAVGGDEKVLAAADDVLARSSGQTVKRQAKFAKATSLRNLGRINEALPLYTELSGDAATAEGAESAYRTIEAAKARGDNAKAEEFVYAFAEKNTPHSFWLGKSFIILGDIYAAAGDSFQARATYQSIVDGYPNNNDGVVEEAKLRIANL